jgi:cell division protein FtsB
MAARGRRRQSRSSSRSSRPSRSALALRWLGAAVLVAIAIGYVQPLRAYQGARGDVAERRAEVEQLERGNAALERRLARAGTTAFVEREARRIGLVRPGERLFIVTGVEEWKLGRKGASGAGLP